MGNPQIGIISAIVITLPRSKGSELHIRLPSLRVLHWEDKTPEHLALKASGTYLLLGDTEGWEK